MAVTLLVTGCATAAEPTSSPADSPSVNSAGFPTATTFDYQLGGPYDPAPGVKLVVRDRTASIADGLYSVCYINAFQTQPGEQDQWPEDLLLAVDGALVTDPDWPDEILLDTSTDSNRATIVDIVSTWVTGCAEAGFRAVEFDNLDSFTRSGDVLTLNDNLALATDLAHLAHLAGLAVGQKNAGEHTSRLRDEAGFDFAVSEECAAYNECPAYTDVYGDAVIDIEYTDTLPRSFAQMCEDSASPSSMILRDRDLVTPNDTDYVFQSCAP